MKIARRFARLSVEPLEARIAPATILVSSTNDSGAGSLRQAVMDANATAAADTIVFKPGLTGTIVLTSGELVVAGPLTVNGPGSAKIIISGNDTSRIFTVDDGAPAQDSPFTISGLALTSGKATGTRGGAIYSEESLTVKNSAIISSTADAGGAIFVNGHDLNKVLITGSTISGNSATVSWGGGLYSGCCCSGEM